MSPGGLWERQGLLIARREKRCCDLCEHTATQPEPGLLVCRHSPPKPTKQRVASQPTLLHKRSSAQSQAWRLQLVLLL